MVWPEKVTEEEREFYKKMIAKRKKDKEFWEEYSKRQSEKTANALTEEEIEYYTEFYERYDKRPRYTVELECIEVRGQCLLWSLGDVLVFDEEIHLDGQDRKSMTKYGRKTQCSYLMHQILDVVFPFCYGVADAVKLGITKPGEDPNIGYMACQSPGIGETPKGHGEVILKIQRIPKPSGPAPLEIEMEQTYFGYGWLKKLGGTAL